MNMNRNEFMRQLESLLQNISRAEREEALQYYNDYFDDAGPENEQAVIEALGNPARVAENIKKDLLANGYGDSIYVQVTANDRAVISYGADLKDIGQDSGQDAGGNNTDAASSFSDKFCAGDDKFTSDKEQVVAWEEPVSEKSDSKQLSNGMLILIIILCVLASPVLLGGAMGILGTLIGIIATWFALILSFGVAAVALIAVFVVLLVVAVLCVTTEPLVSVALLGGGMVCAGVGLLLLMLTVAMAGIATPAIYNGIVTLCRKIFGNRKVASVA